MRVGLEVYIRAMSSVAHHLLLAPVDQDVELSAPSAPCLPVIHHIPRRDDNGLNLSKSSDSIFLHKLSGAVIKGYEQDVGTRTSFYGFTAFSLTQSILILGRRGFQHVPLGKDV